MFVVSARAQENKEARLLHFTSSHTAFPDTARARGHLYDSVLYTASEHYSDSSVLLIIPPQLQAGSKVDLIFWFHGWRNTIDTAAEFYGLTRQFVASHRNAVLVLAETAKNAPDSYGGKLEQPGMFNGLVKDVMNELKKNNIVPRRAEPGNIALAGHSGAFRVIAYILQNGQMPVQEVLLFGRVVQPARQVYGLDKTGRASSFRSLVYQSRRRHGQDERYHDAATKRSADWLCPCRRSGCAAGRYKK